MNVNDVYKIYISNNGKIHAKVNKQKIINLDN